MQNFLWCLCFHWRSFFQPVIPCVSDAGIVLSHSVLQAVGGKLTWCTRNTYSETDTDNLGRCILHATDKPCVSSVQVFNFHVFNPSGYIKVFCELKRFLCMILTDMAFFYSGSAVLQLSVTWRCGCCFTPAVDRWKLSGQGGCNSFQCARG